MKLTVGNTEDRFSRDEAHISLVNCKLITLKLALEGENMSSGFLIRLDSYQSAQLQRLGRMFLIFCMFQVYQLYSSERDNKGTDRTAWMPRLV